MKKTFIIATLLLSGVAFGASRGYSDLDESLKTGVVLAYDFTTSGDPLVSNLGNTSGNLNFALKDGHGLMGSASTETCAWASGISNVGEDFTISFDIVSCTDPGNWGAFLNLYSNGSTTGDWGMKNVLSITTDNASNIRVDNSIGGYTSYSGGAGFNMGATKLANLPESVTITLVSDKTNGALTFYLDGEIVGTHAWAPDGTNVTSLALTGINFGVCMGGLKDKLAGETLLDNVTIWNKALTAAEVKSTLAPEPATATLSLLALAGLAARRRRH